MRLIFTARCYASARPILALDLFLAVCLFCVYFLYMDPHGLIQINVCKCMYVCMYGTFIEVPSTMARRPNDVSNILQLYLVDTFDVV